MGVIRMVSGDCRGQATVELAALLPVVLILGVVIMNAMQFMSACAVSERLFPQFVRVYAASPDYGETATSAAARIEDSLNESLSKEGAWASVSVEEDGRGNNVYSAELTFEPSLFGLNFRSILFGIELPPLRHLSACAVSKYRPGVLA